MVIWAVNKGFPVSVILAFKQIFKKTKQTQGSQLSNQLVARTKNQGRKKPACYRLPLPWVNQQWASLNSILLVNSGTMAWLRGKNITHGSHELLMY